MKVGFLGTAGAITSADRGNTSLVVAADTVVLVDCSGNPPQGLARLGFDWTELEHVVLTHRHADHLDGLPSLVHQLRLAHRDGARRLLNIWGPSCALAVARQLLDAVGLFERDDMFDLALHPLPAAPSTQVLGDLQLEAFPVAHGEVPTLGLRLSPSSNPKAIIVHSADTEPCASVWRRSRAARLLVHECSSLLEPSRPGHTTLAEIEAQLPTDAATEVRLVHLPPTSPEQAAAAAASLAKRFGDRVRLASDGELWELGAS